jgi:hypothetical protein
MSKYFFTKLQHQIELITLDLVFFLKNNIKFQQIECKKSWEDNMEYGDTILISYSEQAYNQSTKS